MTTRRLCHSYQSCTSLCFSLFFSDYTVITEKKRVQKKDTYMGRNGPTPKNQNCSENCMQNCTTWEHAKVHILNLIKIRITLTTHPTQCICSFQRPPIKIFSLCCLEETADTLKSFARYKGRKRGWRRVIWGAAKTFRMKQSLGGRKKRVGTLRRYISCNRIRIREISKYLQTSKNEFDIRVDSIAISLFVDILG